MIPLTFSLATALGLLLPMGDPKTAAEPQSIQPEGRWSNGFAYSLVISPDEQFAYVGSGGTILVCSLAGAPTQRKPIAQIPTDGFVFSLALSGNDLFAAGSRAGLFHADVTTPAAASTSRRIAPSQDIAFDVAARGDLVALADGAAGVLLLEKQGDGFRELARVPTPNARALGIALGADFAVVALGEGGVGRIDLRDRTKPSLVTTSPTRGLARSIALTEDHRFALVAEDTADLTLRDANTLEVKAQREFQLPEDKNPGPQRSPKPATPLAAARVRVLGNTACVSLEATELAAQISPFTPEYGAWKGEPHYDPRAAVALVSIASAEGRAPALEVLGFCDALRSRPLMSWNKDVALLRNGDVFGLDFVNGVFRLRLNGERPRRDGLPALTEFTYEIDTRAGGLDVEMSPTAKDLLYVESDIGGLQIFDVADPKQPKMLARVADGGGTFCAVTTRMERDSDGSEHPIDYVFINNFFRVGICRIDLRDPSSAHMLKPLWITLPAAVRGKRQFEGLGLTPRSYRVSIDGDWLDVVATNTVFGWQRFSITEVLACETIANIHEGIERPPEYARYCEPVFRAITSPDQLSDSKRLIAAPFARPGKVMGLLVRGNDVILGSGAQRTAGGRGGRGGGEPHDGYLQYFDLSDPVVLDPLLGALRFPRATQFIEKGEVQIGLALRDTQLFVADTAGLVRVFRFDPAGASGADRRNSVFTLEPQRFENLGHYGADSVFDLVIEDDVLHVAGWSAGYLRLWIGGATDGAKDDRFLTTLARFDSPGLPISLTRTASGRTIVAEHNAGFLVMPPTPAEHNR